MVDNENNKNINDLGENITPIDDLADISKSLSDNISSKIFDLSNELNSILFELEKKDKNYKTISEELNKEESPYTKELGNFIEEQGPFDDFASSVEIVDNRNKQPEETTQEDIMEEPVVEAIEEPTIEAIEEITEEPAVEEEIIEEPIVEEEKVVEPINEEVIEEVKETPIQEEKEDSIGETAQMSMNLSSIIDEIEQDIKQENKQDEKKHLFAKKEKSQDKKKKAVIVPPSGDDGNNRSNKNKKHRSNRPEGKKSTFVLATISVFIVFFCILGACGAGYFLKNMCKGIPEFSPADLDSADSTIIYDSEGNQVIELGLYLRENIEYDELPTCVIDSFLSIEDSRFFSHFGFDIPRFTKALLENLRSMSFGQGGSTMTMQLVKLSYFQVDDGEDSTMASRSGMSGIQRKVQEIVLSIKAEQELSKKELMSLYLNKVNFGDNIRGIQKAAEYYFGKDAKELSLNEAAFLAGIVNAPNGNNPYNAAIYEDIGYLNNANARKNEVLDLMVYHGYITEEEAKINKAVRIENLVVGKDDKFRETNTYYQSYIDAVINEAQEVTGKNPYTTAMNIYTTMDPYMQEYVYNMQNHPELFADKYRFRHDDQQNALVVLNNQTGELIALGGGRYQEDSARQFNRAVDSYINPGSTVKPVLEYVLAFDRLGYATSHTICDKPVFLYETDIAITNAYGQGYTGDMQITEALARSLNTPAIQLMAELLDYYEDDPRYEHPEDPIIEYCQSIGFDSCNENTFDIQWAIGGRDCLVSPVQLAGAHAMLINDGMYIKPHTIQRIEYRGKYNEKPDFIADTTGTRVVSSGAAYMAATCLNYNVNSGWIGQLNLLRRDYPTYAKTGTTNFSENSYVQFNIPESAAKDQWLCTQTSNYTIVVWNGFDKLAEGAFFTVDDENYNLKCKLGSILLDALMDHFHYDAPGVKRPDDVVDIEHILGCFPYAKGGSAKGLISANSPYVNLVDESSIVKETVGGTLYHMGALESADGLYVHWDEFNAYLEDGRVDTSITSVSGNKTVIASGRSYYPRYNFVNPGGFFATITAASGETFDVDSPVPTALVPVVGEPPYTVCGWTAANPNPVCGSSRPNKDQ